VRALDNAVLLDQALQVKGEFEMPALDKMALPLQGLALPLQRGVAHGPGLKRRKRRPVDAGVAPGEGVVAVAELVDFVVVPDDAAPIADKVSL